MTIRHRPDPRQCAQFRSAETQGPSTPRVPLFETHAALEMTVELMLREHRYYVYIMQSSSRRALYIGMSNNLHRRVFQHKTQECEGFTNSYDAVRLVYWESCDEVHKTIAREKQLKNWRREKKLWLIASMNPKFKDLAADWYEKENPTPRRA